MKYLAIILSVYMTLLSLLPCQDSEDMMASVLHVTVQKSNSCNKQGSQETCPPFCTCSCCSTARHVSANLVIPVFVKTIIKVYPAYGIPAIQKQPIKIWQPPQIA